MIEFKEYFVCPFCGFKIHYKIGVGEEYTCNTRCHECKKSVKMVDKIERCCECLNKVGCIADPAPIIYAYLIERSRGRNCA